MKTDSHENNMFFDLLNTIKDKKGCFFNAIVPYLEKYIYFIFFSTTIHFHFRHDVVLSLSFSLQGIKGT